MNDTVKGKFYSIIGNKIKAYREEAHITQVDLAQKLQLSRTSIVNIEQGRQHPYIHLLFEIAELLNVELISILPTYDELNRGMTIDIDLIKKSVKKEEDIKTIDDFFGKI
jgi:DNA-binding XRE family transcriptional regulator